MPLDDTVATIIGLIISISAAIWEILQGVLSGVALKFMHTIPVQLIINDQV